MRPMSCRGRARSRHLRPGPQRAGFQKRQGSAHSLFAGAFSTACRRSSAGQEPGQHVDPARVHGPHRVSREVEASSGTENDQADGRRPGQCPGTDNEPPASVNRQGRFAVRATGGPFCVLSKTHVAEPAFRRERPFRPRAFPPALPAATSTYTSHGSSTIWSSPSAIGHSSFPTRPRLSALWHPSSGLCPLPSGIRHLSSGICHLPISSSPFPIPDSPFPIPNSPSPHFPLAYV